MTSTDHMIELRLDTRKRTGSCVIGLLTDEHRTQSRTPYVAIDLSSEICEQDTDEALERWSTIYTGFTIDWSHDRSMARESCVITSTLCYMFVRFDRRGQASTRDVVPNFVHQFTTTKDARGDFEAYLTAQQYWHLIIRVHARALVFTVSAQTQVTKVLHVAARAVNELFLEE